MKGTSQLVAELRQARKAKNRESFLGGVYELVQRHKSWLAHRYGTFDERIEDGLQQAFIEALEHADFDSILHPDAYFKTVAINFIRSERQKTRRHGSLEELAEGGVEFADDQADAREELIVQEYHRLLLELDLGAVMAESRRQLERKSPVQAFLLTRRAEETKISYVRLAEELGRPTDARTLTSLRVHYLRAKENYADLFGKALRHKAGNKQAQCQEALMHYLNNIGRYPPIPGVSDTLTAREEEQTDE
ncbi:RNA polymerase sigma factor [Candidatus Sumerlaeota bacterium]